ncbi:MAG: hypothetical protein Q4G05_06875, partial [Clostridia bacterium]|nr:hypothetical protein [Clostridia bacterium]
IVAFATIIFSILYVCLIVFSMLFSWKYNNPTPLIYAIPSTGGVITIIITFYFNKSKAENQIKLRSTYGNEVIDKVNFNLGNCETK